MKKSLVAVFVCALALLLVMQIASLTAASRTRRELQNLEGTVSSLASSLYGSVSSAVQGAITSGYVQQESQLASFTYSFGALDIESMTLPMHIELTPKQVRANTTVSLRIDGVLYEMQRSDTRYTLEHTISAIYGVGGEITVMMREGDETKTQVKRVYFNAEDYLQSLRVYAGLSCQIGYTKNKIANLHFTASPDVSIGNSDASALQELRFVAFLDGVLVYENGVEPAAVGWSRHEAADGDAMQAAVDFQIDVQQGQELMIWMQAKDANGLIHQCLLQGGEIGAQGPVRSGVLAELSGKAELLFKPDGTLLRNESGIPADYAVLIPW